MNHYLEYDSEFGYFFTMGPNFILRYIPEKNLSCDLKIEIVVSEARTGSLL